MKGAPTEAALTMHRLFALLQFSDQFIDSFDGHAVKALLDGEVARRSSTPIVMYRRIVGGVAGKDG
jgi:hypothetical protein